MPHKKLNVSPRGMLDAYEALLKTRSYVADAAQMAAAGALQALYGNLLAFKVNRNSTFKRLLAPPARRRAASISGAGSGAARAS